MITLIQYQLGRAFRIHPLTHRLVIGFRRHLADVLAALRQRFMHGFGIAVGSRLQRHSQQRAAFQIHCMLGLVGQMRAAIFHLRNARIRIMRIFPIVVGALLRTFAVQLRQLLAGRCFDSRFLRQPLRKIVVCLAGISPHDGAQRRIRFQCRSIDGYGVAFQQTFLGQHLQDPAEHYLVRFYVDQSSCPRNRRMIRCGIAQSVAEKRAKGQRIGRAPCTPAFRIDSFEVPDQQQPEIHCRRQSRPAFFRIEPPARLFREPVKLPLVQKTVQLFVKRMPARRCQRSCLDPDSLLLLPFTLAYRHAPS